MTKYRSIPSLTPVEIDRFWAKVDKTSDPNGCWLWTASLSSVGYGAFGIGGRKTNKVYLAHRVAYELIVGTIPDGLQIDHICMVRCCVNPDHMEPVTQRENILRGNGMSARHARQTHCKRGHEFNDENSEIDSLGRRVCKVCRRQVRRKLYHARKQVA